MIARALGSSENLGAAEALMSIARDDDETVRHAAISSLGDVSNSEALRTLAELADSGSESDRAAAISALGSSESDLARDKIVELIERGGDNAARAAIGVASGGRGAAALLAVLDDLSRTDGLRRAAASQLRDLGIRVDSAEQSEIDKLLADDS